MPRINKYLGTGGGDLNPRRIKRCERCNGHGKIKARNDEPNVNGLKECPVCKGKKGKHLGTI